MSWGDSFHQKPVPIHCTGVLSKDGKKLVFNGTWRVGKGPAWGWRTEFALTGKNNLLMEAFVVHPKGMEMKVVEAKMTRTKPQ